MDKNYIQNVDVNQYFLDRMKKVYIDRCLKIETFEQYLSHRYGDNCYYYSSYALMGLDFSDKIMRGRIDIGKPDILELFSYDKNPNSNYYHGWCEFTFNNHEYVFDSMIKGIITKKEYYQERKPVISYQSTLEDVLSYYLSSECADKVGEHEYIVKKMGPYHGHDDQSFLTWTMYKSKITMDEDDKHLVKFIAYTPPSG